MKRSPPFALRNWYVTLGLLLAFAASAPAASPRQELLQLVPDDVGFCLVIQDLRSHSAAVLASPFLQTLRQAQNSSAVDLQKFDGLDGQVEKLLGVSWSRLRDDVLGDCVVLAYRLGKEGKPGEGQGLALLWARDPQLLADLVGKLNSFQKLSGDLKVLEERAYHGQKYFHRLEKKEEEGYYYLRGPALVFATREELLREAIDRQALSASGESFVAQQLRLLGVESRLAALWINPRAFDAAMASTAANAEGQQGAFLKNFLRYWKALDGIALSATVESDVQLEAAIRARPADLPAAARRLFAEAARPSEFLRQYGEDTLLALGGRFDTVAFYQVVGEFLTPEDRQAVRGALERSLGAVLDRDLVKDVLPCLGPDWGLTIAAPPASERSWFPQVVLAIAVRPGEDRAAPVDQLMLSVVEFAAQLVVVSYNQQHTDQVVLKTAALDHGRIRYLANEQAFPPGFQPAFALNNGYLLLASSPDVLRRLSPSPAGAPPSSKNDQATLLRASVKRLRVYLKERFATLASYLAEKNGIPKDEASRRLDELLNALQFIDQVELTQQTQKGQVNLILHLRLAQPLR